MEYLLDSSVWVALFLDFDTQHKKAQRVFEQLRGRIYLPYCIVSEVITVLTYKHSKEQGDNFIAFVEENRSVILLDHDMRDELAFYPSVRERISFPDAVLLFLTKKLGVTLITFDKQLGRLLKKL